VVALPKIEKDISDKKAILDRDPAPANPTSHAPVAQLKSFSNCEMFRLPSGEFKSPGQKEDYESCLQILTFSAPPRVIGGNTFKDCELFKPSGALSLYEQPWTNYRFCIKIQSVHATSIDICNELDVKSDPSEYSFCLSMVNKNLKIDTSPNLITGIKSSILKLGGFIRNMLSSGTSDPTIEGEVCKGVAEGDIYGYNAQGLDIPSGELKNYIENGGPEEERNTIENARSSGKDACKKYFSKRENQTRWKISPEECDNPRRIHMSCRTKSAQKPSITEEKRQKQKLDKNKSNVTTYVCSTAGATSITEELKIVPEGEVKNSIKEARESALSVCRKFYRDFYLNARYEYEKGYNPQIQARENTWAIEGCDKLYFTCSQKTITQEDGQKQNQQEVDINNALRNKVKVMEPNDTTIKQSDTSAVSK
jgi:hypothetical protein